MYHDDDIMIGSEVYGFSLRLMDGGRGSVLEYIFFVTPFVPYKRHQNRLDQRTKMKT